jgi:cytochrome c biogenesis protein CcdA
MEDINKKKLVIAIIIVIGLIIFFFLAKQASPDYFKELGLVIPLPLFTSIIALIDGFNPCTMWVLTFLLVLLISVSHSRRRIFAVGFTFVVVVYIIYFLFMIAWLNVFLYIGWLDPVRIAIGLLALIAGGINCKEFFAFRKGITLMIQERYKGPLVRRIENMKDIIRYGSLPALVAASIALAAFSSLVELPCTAGWPVIYTKILAEKVFSETMIYYLYVLFYNVIYVMPLAVIILLFGYFFRGKQITKKQMQVIKLFGGLIMILLGIILLFNPELLMLV